MDHRRQADSSTFPELAASPSSVCLITSLASGSTSTHSSINTTDSLSQLSWPYLSPSPKIDATITLAASTLAQVQYNYSPVSHSTFEASSLLKSDGALAAGQTADDAAEILINITINEVRSLFARAAATEESDLRQSDIDLIAPIFRFNPWPAAQEIRSTLYGRRFRPHACWLILRWIGAADIRIYNPHRLWLFQYAIAHEWTWVRDAAALGLLDMAERAGAEILETAAKVELDPLLREDFQSIAKHLRQMR
jgi:hypothetical protein